jgi:predicted ribosomally synthesized peptide with nif11-like leader
MSAMKDLYLKVAADAALQAKVGKIFEESGTDKEALVGKLIKFGKEQGFEISKDDIIEFYKSMEESGGQLSDEELDSVAGGKQQGPRFSGIYCTQDPVIMSAIPICGPTRFIF